jgi:hypothetical protein
VCGGVDNPVMWHTGIVGEGKLMTAQAEAVTFRLLADSALGDEMCLRVGVSGTPEQLEEGWLGQMLYGRPAEGLTQGGVYAAMEVLKQFKGSACNHYAYHPLGGRPLEVAGLSGLQTQKAKGVVAVKANMKGKAKEAPLDQLLPKARDAPLPSLSICCAEVQLSSAVPMCVLLGEVGSPPGATESPGEGVARAAPGLRQASHHPVRPAVGGKGPGP